MNGLAAVESFEVAVFDLDAGLVGAEAALPIVIGDNVWLGGGVIVCPGVTIGDNSVISAGAVVIRDIAADVVAVDSPAYVIRSVHD